LLYFKNSELTTTYHVALNTVLNWIKAAQQGKLDLELVDVQGRNYIANTARNVSALDELVSKRKKYRNTRTTRTVTPRPEFYEIYDEQETQDIISSLDIRREVPRAYNYFAEGAHYWDEYSAMLAQSETPNLVNQPIRLLEATQPYLDALLKPYARVNVIDIGVGNAIPVRGLLQRLIDRQQLGRYIALDISPQMIDIARENIADWFGYTVPFEGYKLDITHERFGHLIADEYLREDPETTVNLVLLFGGTLLNMSSPDDALTAIANSMGRRDLFLVTSKLDSDRTRNYFDFSSSPKHTSLAPIHRFVFDLLNIDESLYDVEVGFHPEKHVRFTRVHLKVSLRIKFDTGGGVRVVEIEKGDSILIWFYRQQTLTEASDMLQKNKFYPLHLTQTPDREYLLAISQLAPVKIL
jgi:SAM-dependent methyltransferase